MSKIIKTFQKRNTSIPIWLLRQAGRYLKEYTVVRSSVNNFLDLCYDVKKAVNITLQPLKKFNLDAAIIFSDILVLPHALGWDVSFKQGEGPLLKKFESEKDMFLLNKKLSKEIQKIYETVSKVRASLSKEKTLIGFAGSPWTVVYYMLEGRAKRDFSVSKNFLYSKNKIAKQLVNIITEKTIEYLFGQIEAGAETLQLFDSWSGVLNGKHYDDFVIEPTKKICLAIKEKYPSVPIIGVPRGSGYNYKKYIVSTGIDGIGVDQFVPIHKMKEWQKKLVVQGNLDPVVLLGNKDNIKNAVDELLSSLDHTNFIFNLGHGILQATPPENVEYLVNYVKEH